MKKILSIVFCLIVSIFLLSFCYNFRQNNYPSEYYNVYLDGELLGTILSKDELEKYIDEKTEHLININEVTKTFCEYDSLSSVLEKDEVKELIESSSDIKYYDKDDKKCVDIIVTNGDVIEKIYTPVGLNIEKTVTYDTNVSSIEDIYSKIVSKKAFTMKGYQFTLYNEYTDKVTVLYVLDKSIFEEAMKKVIETYVGKEDYENYLNNTQKEIKTTGERIDNIYIYESITVKEKQIPVDENIYTSSSSLATFLLYGNNPVTSKYVVKEGESVSDIALANEISNQEFLFSNPKYKSEDALIMAGTEVVIKQTNPQVKVVVEKYLVEDQASKYRTIILYDEDMYVGTEKVKQKGENGLVRVSKKLKIENGLIVYVVSKGKDILKDTIDETIVKGEKIIPNVGDLTYWEWPSEPGWTSTDGYAWRINPVTGVRGFHYGIDIAGTGYNSAVYAANNGTIQEKGYRDDYGNYILINHNNGYYTLYAHMNKFVSYLSIGDTVSRGEQIGYVGSTGWSTGPHIHFEVWKGCLWCRISPWSIYE